MKTPQLPIHKLSLALGLASEVWLKREDLHHYGSHKGRSIPLMIAHYHKEGATQFSISSSGNAALAAALSIQAHNKNKPSDPLSLQIFVGENIDATKLKQLKKFTDQHISLTQSANPKQQTLKWAKTNAAIQLRQSTDENALTGYTELAEELSKIENLTAVFVPTSSGTAAVGLYLGFKKLNLNPQIHIIQTTSCHPMVPSPLPLPPLPSIATAIVDKVAHRKLAVLEIIKNSHGSGWVATNEEIIKAIKLVKETTGIDISPNSALSVVGLMQAIHAGSTFSGPVVCLITGK
ncbi:MAG: hypothetical protein A2754_00850 [Candidatus Magasanikbacteria bacterium RIFCSPHIGHO2_01_FULL_47_8]|uniref:Tryptophan synthase beta chain-like PALP domain-containing protein n=1 Tax=Candidatus Magasanikbacteria bacterium RIFCSPHIGHO2_01_FULL_47_8 TaxID=1798673 RepID=A0A1F6MCV3_9BACT|nr:MAG: hypothetical protein A2754_00850 [Candidatus Magasanikbacteria bacterium RIFCSPHIGHO2_01_FULL_47_8]